MEVMKRVVYVMRLHSGHVIADNVYLLVGDVTVALSTAQIQVMKKDVAMGQIFPFGVTPVLYSIISTVTTVIAYPLPISVMALMTVQMGRTKKTAHMLQALL